MQYRIILQYCELQSWTRSNYSFDMDNVKCKTACAQAMLFILYKYNYKYKCNVKQVCITLTYLTSQPSTSG